MSLQIAFCAPSHFVARQYLRRRQPLLSLHLHDHPMHRSTHSYIFSPVSTIDVHGKRGTHQSKLLLLAQGARTIRCAKKRIPLRRKVRDESGRRGRLRRHEVRVLLVRGASEQK